MKPFALAAYCTAGAGADGFSGEILFQFSFTQFTTLSGGSTIEGPGRSCFAVQARSQSLQDSSSLGCRLGEFGAQFCVLPPMGY